MIKKLKKWALRRPPTDEAGFTLIEMMVVIILIAMVGTFVTGKIFDRLNTAKVESAKTQIRNIRSVLQHFYLDCNFYPSTEQGLEALLSKPQGRECKNYSPGGYIEAAKVPEDPWGKPFVYLSDGSSYEIRSLGADNQEGGEGQNADISSKEI